MSLTPVVSPSILGPGLYLSVNLLAGAASPGTGTLRIALVATKGSSGDLTDDTEVRTLSGTGTDASGSATSFGPGTPGDLAARRLFSRYGAAVIDAISPVAGATAATASITASGATSVDSVVDVDIAGRTFEVVWGAGVSLADFATALIDAINARGNDLPVTAASGGAGVCTVTSKITGNIGNDIYIHCDVRDQQGTEAVGGATAWTTKLTGGTTDPNLTNALAALAGKEYHFIVPVLSNTDIANTGTANNVSKIIDHIELYNEGKNAKLQQTVYGYTGSLATAIAAAPHSNAGSNSEYGECLLCINGRSLPGEFGAEEAGARIAAISVDPAYNRIGEEYVGLYGAHDKIADQPTSTEVEQALGAGVSIVGYTAQDAEYLIRGITTHSQDSAGGADRRLLDTQNVDGTFVVARDLRSQTPIQFEGAKIMPDRTDPTTPLPPNVSEERDIKAFIVSRIRYWEGQGVVYGEGFDEILENDELIVQINASDATQVDTYIPFEIIQPLAKIGMEVARIPS